MYKQVSKIYYMYDIRSAESKYGTHESRKWNINPLQAIVSFPYKFKRSSFMALLTMQWLKMCCMYEADCEKSIYDIYLTRKWNLVAHTSFYWFIAPCAY